MPEVTRPSVPRAPPCLGQDRDLRDQKLGPNSEEPLSITTWRAYTLHGAEQHTCMRQAEGPEPQVGRGVGDAAKAVLDGVDGLRHQDLPKVELKDNRGHQTPQPKLLHCEALAGLRDRAGRWLKTAGPRCDSCSQWDCGAPHPSPTLTPNSTQASVPCDSNTS